MNGLLSVPTPSAVFYALQGYLGYPHLAGVIARFTVVTP